MPYGTIKVDTITFTDAGVDKSVSISGLVQNPTFTGNVTATGTISGLIVQAPTVTGTTANFASGVYTTQISGAIVKVPAGSAGAPSIQVGVGASVAPGLYGAGTDLLGISTGGAGRIFIDSTGQLGIGTSSPQNALVVSNGGAEGLEFVPSASGSPTLIAFNRGTASYAPLTLNGSQQIFQTSGTDRLSIDSSGRVGIGITAPAAALDIEGQAVLSNATDAFGIKISNSSVKTYPAAGGIAYGSRQSYEIGNTTSITSPTVSFVGNGVLLSKSLGNTQDIDGFSLFGHRVSGSWNDLNTCKSFIDYGTFFIYSGVDANSRTSSTFTAFTLLLAVPDLGTQTIETVISENLTFSGFSTGTTSTTNVTNWSGGRQRGFQMSNPTSGTRTYNLTNGVFFDTNPNWGIFGSGGATFSATVTNLFGLRLRPPASTTGLTITNNWGLYQEWSSAKNWFAGESNQFPNITTTASGANAFLDSADSNRLYRSTSSLVYKRDIEDLDSTFADQILNLRPVWYRSKCDADCQDWSWYGLIAEEVAEIDPRFVHYGYQEDAYEFVETTETVELSPDDPRREEEGIETEEIIKQTRQLKTDAQQVPNGVAYERLVVPLLDIIKRQKSQLDSFETRLAALEAR